MTAPATAESAADRSLLRSPGLNQFRKNPFRLLRLPITATAKQAVWQCDKALARARVGMALPDPDPVPWLAAGDEIEIQEAAQTMESPLARLVEQLLWFDDPEILAALAAEDATKLRGYLEHAQDLPIGELLDRANLRLLLGFSMLRGIGPMLAAGSSASTAALAWKANGGLRLVEDPHKALVSQASTLATLTWALAIGDGLATWGGALSKPALAEHVRTKIASLDDELLGADDVEAVLSAIRTRLADLVVGETKHEMSLGKVKNVAQLSAVAGKCGIDSEVWLVAFRPLRAQFQAELAELAPEAETGKGPIEDVAAYLDRLATLADRWRPLDEAQLLGLSSLIDDAAADAFERLRATPWEQQLAPRFREVLDRVSSLAASTSVKERIRGYEGRLADVQKAMCHFCGKRELEGPWCASLSSQVETSREQYGNTIHVQYKLGARPVARCSRCAQIHGFIRKSGHLTFGALATSVLFISILHPATWFKSISMGAGLVLFAVGIAAAFGLGYAGRSIVASLIVPKGERTFGDYYGSRAFEGLREDGFMSMKYDFRPNAWELVNTQGVKARHSGGDGTEALKAMGYVGLVILVVGLRFCMH
ncbi:MAG: hypothetical protein ABI867_08125 [Kofleriaceae bacterium]